MKTVKAIHKMMMRTMMMVMCMYMHHMKCYCQKTTQ